MRTQMIFCREHDLPESADVFPAERGDVRQEIGREGNVLGAQVLHGTIEIDDSSGDQAQSGRPDRTIGFRPNGAPVTCQPIYMRSRKLELPRGFPHKHLKLARLPFRHDRTVGRAAGYSR